MAKRAIITHLHIKKTGIIAGIVLGACGLIAGIADALFNGIMKGILSPATSFLFPGGGVWGIILLPVFCFAAGLFLGVLVAWLFNLTVKLTGGLEIEIEDNKRLTTVKNSVPGEMT